MIVTLRAEAACTSCPALQPVKKSR